MNRAFNYRNRAMYCEEVPVPEIAQKFGTPLYLYSYEEIRRRYRQFFPALDSYDSLLCYALKSNSNKAIVSLLSRKGAGGDVISGEKLIKALEPGISPEKIVFDGRGKNYSGNWTRTAKRNTGDFSRFSVSNHLRPN